MENRIVYLAAGNGRRFGNNKLLTMVDGAPLFEHALNELARIVDGNNEYSLLVVTQYEPVLQYVKNMRQERVEAVMSPKSVDGISFSIKKGIEKPGAADGYDTFVVADAPYLSYDMLKTFMQKTIESGCDTGCVCVGDRLMNPVMFKTHLEKELMLLEADEGGKKVLMKHLDSCFRFQAWDSELADIDYPSDIKEQLDK